MGSANQTKTLRSVLWKIKNEIYRKHVKAKLLAKSYRDWYQFRRTIVYAPVRSHPPDDLLTKSESKIASQIFLHSSGKSFSTPVSILKDEVIAMNNCHFRWSRHYCHNCHFLKSSPMLKYEQPKSCRVGHSLIAKYNLPKIEKTNVYKVPNLACKDLSSPLLPPKNCSLHMWVECMSFTQSHDFRWQKTRKTWIQLVTCILADRYSRKEGAC